VVAWWQLPCNIIMAGSSQQKVWKWWQKKKKGNNQLEEQQHEWWCGSIIAAGSRQCKAEVVAKKEKKETIKLRSGIVSGGMVATAEQHRHIRQQTAHSRSGSKKRKKVTINRCSSMSGGCNSQLEVQQHEWWHGGNSHAKSSWQAADSA